MDAVVASWSTLARWDFKYAKILAYRAANPTFRPLGESVVEATVLVNPQSEPDREWPVYGVNNRDGVFLNELRLGSDFNQNQKGIERDWFFHNPTRANVGSIGRVPEVEPNAVTSPEYQVWRMLPDSTFTADFLEVLIRTPTFLDQVKIHRVGAVKERLYVDNLREILVPMIGRDEQSEIVAEVRKARLALSKARDHLVEAQRKSSEKIGRYVTVP